MSVQVHTYTRCMSFVSHVYRQHRSVILGTNSGFKSCTVDASEVETFGNTGDLYENTYEQNSEDQLNLQHAIDQVLERDEHEQQKKDALFILSLKEVRFLSESAVDHVVKETQRLFKHTIGRVHAGVNECISKSGIDPSTIPNLDQFLCSVEQPFEGLHSTFLQEKFYKEHLGCIVSEQNNNYIYNVYR